VNTILVLRIQRETGNFLSSLATTSFSRRVIHHGVNYSGICLEKSNFLVFRTANQTCLNELRYMFFSKYFGLLLLQVSARCAEEVTLNSNGELLMPKTDTELQVRN
jgi:hypothetical protein